MPRYAAAPRPGPLGDSRLMTATSLRRARQRRADARADATPAPPQTARREPALTVEVALYGLFLVLAVLSRFWDLGRRALHHDESLHAQFSWLLATGRGYIHDPLMHGPFLFHANALAYLLFGANDATSRIVPALTGCVLVLIPWLMRDAIGRWGALFASFLLLISPGFLYYGRFIRHDIYTATASLLLVACVIRYIADRRPRWVYLGALALIWAYSNHEISYAMIAIIVSFLAAIVIWRLSPRLAAIAAGGLLVMGFTAAVLPRLIAWPALPPIPWRTPTWDAIFGFLGGVLSNPMVIALLIEGLVVLVAGLIVIRQLIRERRAAAATRGDKTTRHWFDVLLGTYEPGSVPHAVYTLAKDSRTFWLGALLFAMIFLVLYTTLFSNMQGILSGLFGAIGYWLGQHDERRGEQPWFYYLSLLPQYELIAVSFGGVMTVLTVVRGVQYWLGRRVGSLRLLTHGFLVYWALFMFVILSWAGEKMPWLITHASLPFTILAAALLGEIVERLLAGDARLSAGGLAWGARYRTALTWLYGGLMLLTAGLFVYGAAQASLAEPARPLPVLPAVGAMALMTIGYGLLVGYRRAGLVCSLALAGLLALAQVRIGWMVSFENGDVPKEQLVYVQSAPDVTRVMAEIEQLSEELTGGKTMNIMYDGGEHGVAWPFEWYLRDFKNKRFMPEGPTSDPGPDWPVLLVGAGYRSKVDPILTEYEGIEYVLRWHYPEEETYRGIAIAPELRPGRSAWKTPEQPHSLADVAASLWHSVALQRDPEQQARLWRYLMYREPYAPLGSFNFILYVRKDALRYYNALRY
jgi:uncharacterized protein (TIGR03663 family)